MPAQFSQDLDSRRKAFPQRPSSPVSTLQAALGIRAPMVSLTTPEDSTIQIPSEINKAHQALLLEDSVLHLVAMVFRRSQLLSKVMVRLNRPQDLVCLLNRQMASVGHRSPTERHRKLMDSVLSRRLLDLE